MAPDLNAVFGGHTFDYSQPGSSGYNLPNLTFGDPSNRRVKVISIGGGVSGILGAYQINKYCQNVEFKIYEKNAAIGGTWYENRYPGCACDIPAHAYTYNFALNPDWPRHMALSGDIWKYLDKVCSVFDLRKHMSFECEVIGAWWQEEQGHWKVTIRESKDGKEVRTFDDTCDLLFYGTGLLNNFKWPDIEGLDTFKGRLIHTADWPKDYQEEEWKKDSVAIIGSGASSIQTVPTMQPFVRHMDIFVRTAVWFVQIGDHFGQNHEYSEEQKEAFRSDPEKLVDFASSIEGGINGMWGGFYSKTEAQKNMQNFFRNRMAEHIKDKRLLDGFTPNFGIGCRRVTPGDPYMKAIQEENVDVHFTHVTKVTPDGVIGADGTERKCDTLVCATGFDVTYKPRFPLVGRGGIDLRDKWESAPEAYLGIGVPDFPNFFSYFGPTWPVENGSVMGPLLAVSEYAVQLVKKLQSENLHSFAPKQSATDAFNAHAQEWIKHTVWKEDCRSWYRDNATGRVNAVWPGSSLHFMRTIRAPRWEDMEIRYRGVDALQATGLDGQPAVGHNMWAWLGSGFTVEQRPEGKDAKLDPAYYLSVGNLDPRWLIAGGCSLEQAKEVVLDAWTKQARAEKEKELDRLVRGEGGSIVRNMPERPL